MKEPKNYTNVKSNTNSAYKEGDGIQTGFGRTQRTSDIYERFINRVQQIDGKGEESNHNAIEDDFNVTFSYAPLSEEELDFFTKSNNDSQANNIVDIKAELDKEITPLYHPIYTPEPTIAPVFAMTHSRGDHETETGSYDSQLLKPLLNNHLFHQKNDKIPAKPVNNIKLLTTGLVCGLLLSAAIVVIFNKVGVLSTLTPSVETNSQTVEHKNQDVAANTTQQTPVTDETAAMEADQANTQNTSKPAAPNVLPATTAPVATQPSIEPEQRQTSRDSTISIEDFEKEAQSTLYRETKN
ncbi:hypothetical protein [Psychrobacter sp. 16-MNA-CIBAN-0192]|uniref:hypothetical protein n=1 Tax=Psychrobacter sp. 16-MNA-CIBAN-0192 TaxID=3140448 RepID=UPI003322EF7B